MSTSNTPIQNSKSFGKKVDFECRDIITHSEEKLSKISNITIAILPFSYERGHNWLHFAHRP